MTVPQAPEEYSPLPSSGEYYPPRRPRPTTGRAAAAATEDPSRQSGLAIVLDGLRVLCLRHWAFWFGHISLSQIRLRAARVAVPRRPCGLAGRRAGGSAAWITAAVPQRTRDGGGGGRGAGRASDSPRGRVGRFLHQRYPSRRSGTAAGDPPAVLHPAGDAGRELSVPRHNRGAQSKPDKAAPRTGKVPTTPATVDATIVTEATAPSACSWTTPNHRARSTASSASRNRDTSTTPCHRLTTSEMLGVLQCGDPTGKGGRRPRLPLPQRVPHQPVPDEPIQLCNRPMLYPRGTLAMANAGLGHQRQPVLPGLPGLGASRRRTPCSAPSTRRAWRWWTIDRRRGGRERHRRRSPPSNAVTIESVRLD